jgi:hypothetical protein
MLKRYKKRLYKLQRVWYNNFGATAPLGVCQGLFVGHVHLIYVTPTTKVFPEIWRGGASSSTTMIMVVGRADYTVCGR